MPVSSRQARTKQRSERKVRDQRMAGRTSRTKRSRAAKNSLFIGALALSVLSFVIYLPALGHPFFNFDDGGYVTENQHVLAGMTWSTFRWALTSTEMGLWHPLTWLSHSLDVELFGLNPAGHHFTSIVLHAMNSALLFLFLVSATGSRGKSWVVAALFAIHPINVESVAWISERKNVLSTFWFFSTLSAYVWYVRRPGWKSYLAMLGSFALSLASKPMAVTLPFLLLPLDWWPLHRVKRWNDRVWVRLLLEKVPLFLLSVASSTLALFAQGRAVANLPFAVRLQNALCSYVLYIWKLVWPAHLGIFYPLPVATLNWTVASAAALFLAAVTALAIWLRRPYLTVGWMWFLGTLLPVIGIVQVGMQGMADRYPYIPAVGIFLMVVWGLDELAGRVKDNLRARIGVIAAALIALAIVTEKQLSYWKTNFAIWQHTLEVTHNNWVAEDKVGDQLLAAGKFDQAYPHFENALRMNPADPLANFDIGARFQSLGMFSQAIVHYKVTIAQDTDPILLSQAYENMGAAYRNLGDDAAAREHYRIALRYNPHSHLASSALEEMDRAQERR
jgi:protein O-mannosyl-transferase